MMKNRLKQFEIGVHVPPPAEFINDYHYDLLKEAGVTHIDHFLTTAEDNFKSLELLRARDMKATCYTSRCEDFYKDDRAVEELAEIFDDEAVYGIYIKDEPTAKTHRRYAEIYKKLKAFHPKQIPYVNLFPDYASSNIQLGIERPISVSTDQEVADCSAFYEKNRLCIKFSVKTPQAPVMRLKTISLLSGTRLPYKNLNMTLDFYEDEACSIHAGHCVLNREETDEHCWRFDARVLLKSGTTYFCCLKPGEGTEFDRKSFTCRLLFEDVYTEYLESWMDGAEPEYLMFDFYPFTCSGERADYFYCLEAIRSTSQKYDVWSAGYIQSIGIKNALVRPNADQIRYHIYSMLAYGIKGLNWFTWWTPECDENSPEFFENGIIDRRGHKTDLYEAAKDMGRQLTALGSVLITLTLQNVYHTGDCLPYSVRRLPSDYLLRPENADDLIISEFTDPLGERYLMIVNKDYNRSKTIPFDANDRLVSVERVDRYNLEKIPCYQKGESDPGFSLDFLAGEGLLLRVKKA